MECGGGGLGRPFGDAAWEVKIQHEGALCLAMQKGAALRDGQKL